MMVIPTVFVEKGEDFELVDASFLDLDERNPMQNENPNLLVDGVIDDHVGFADIDFKSPAYIYFTNPVLMILGYGFVKYGGDIEKALYILNEADDLLLNKPRQLVDVNNSRWKNRKLMKDNNDVINKWLDKG